MDESRDGSVGIYALAVTLAHAVPIPLLDDILGEAARGAAMRRVAARHGVRLTRDARRILAQHGDGDATGRGIRAARSVISRFVLPIRWVTRVEVGLRSYGDAVLLDHYLRTAERRPHAPMTPAEAERVRSAIDGSGRGGMMKALGRVPRGASRIGKDLADAIRGTDSEDRAPAERLLDAVLDVFADAPDAVSHDVRARFDAALEAARPELSA